MNDDKKLEVGQVLWLKLKFDNKQEYSSIKHPYLIIEIDKHIRLVNLLQFDSLAGKEYNILMKENYFVSCDEPEETVIYKDSYIQLNRIIHVQLCEELKQYRKTTDKLSRGKLELIAKKYSDYIVSNDIADSRISTYSKEDILANN